jgi:hypothetical protein
MKSNKLKLYLNKMRLSSSLLNSFVVYDKRRYRLIE